MNPEFETRFKMALEAAVKSCSTALPARTRRRGQAKGTRDDRSGSDWLFKRNVTKPKRS